MAEWTDVCSSTPVRTPKLQLAPEQPLTGECWIPPETDTPCPRAKEKSQKCGRKGEIVFKIKPHTHQRCLEDSNKILCPPGDPTETEPDLPLTECLLWRSRSAVDCLRGRGSGCSRLGYDISLLGGGHH